MKKLVIKKIVLIALLAADMLCLLMPTFVAKISFGSFGAIQFKTDGLDILGDSIIRTVVICTIYVLSVILMELKSKIFFISGLASLMSYLAVVIFYWDFELIELPGIYVQLAFTIVIIITFVVTNISKLNLINKKVLIATLAIIGAVVASVIISLIGMGIEKLVDSINDNTEATDDDWEDDEEKENNNDDETEKKTAGSSSEIITTMDGDKESGKEEETTTNSNIDVDKIIFTDEEIEKYEEALEWIFGRHIGPDSDLFYVGMEDYAGCFTNEIIKNERKYRRAEGMDDPIQSGGCYFFIEAELAYTNGDKKIYVPRIDENGEIDYCSYLTMSRNLPFGENARYAITSDGKFYSDTYMWQQDSLSEDEMLLGQREKLGFHNISIRSVDNSDRVITFYDHTHSCHYRALFNENGEIYEINVGSKNKSAYNAFMEFMANNISNNISVAIRDFDEDGLEEMMVLDSEGIPGYNISFYEYEDGKLNKSYVEEFSYTDVGEITKKGFSAFIGSTSSRYLVMEESFYSYNDDGLECTDSAIVEYDENDELIYFIKKERSKEDFTELLNEIYEEKKIRDTVYGRKPHYVDKDYVRQFAHNHGLIDEYNALGLDEEATVKETEWVLAYKKFLDGNKFEELMAESIIGSLSIFENVGSIKGFFLHDINNDNIPELLVQKIYGKSTGTYVYKYNETSDRVERYNVYIQNEASGLLPYSFAQSYVKAGGNGLLLYNNCPTLGYRKDTGNIISFRWNGGSQAFGMTVNEYASNMKSSVIYSECFSTEAGYTDDTKRITQGSAEVYSSFINNYVPFLFVEITDENINKYIVNNYKESGMYEYSLDDVDIAYGFNR